MDRLDLLKTLADGCFEYFHSAGLSPIKCRQLVTENMKSWKMLPIERLQELIEKKEFTNRPS